MVIEARAIAAPCSRWWHVQLWLDGAIVECAEFAPDLFSLRCLLKQRFGRRAIPIQVEAFGTFMTIMDAAFAWFGDGREGELCSHCLEEVEEGEVPLLLFRGEGVHETWLRKLTNPQAAIVRELIGVYPNAIEKTELAEKCEASPTSSSYGNNLGTLRTLGIIDYPQQGFAAATDLLFPPGLT